MLRKLLAPLQRLSRLVVLSLLTLLVGLITWVVWQRFPNETLWTETLNDGVWRTPALWTLLSVLSVLAILLLLVGCVRVLSWRRRRALENALDTEKAMAREEQLAVREKWNLSMQELRVKSGLGLYDMPWFLLIGEADGGKTSMLRALQVSGFKSQIGNNLLPEPGPTEQCDWWFLNGGIVLDTAGAYGAGGADGRGAAGMSELLRLLKRGRGRCPIDGAIVAIPCTSLLGDSAAQIEKKASQLRDKLEHIERTLEARFPVTVIITKCDEVLGFTEFFAKFSDEELKQMLGWSNPARVEDPLDNDQWSLVFDDLHSSLSRWRKHLLDGGVESDRLDTLYAFPDEFLKMKEALQGYFSTLFSENLYLDPLFMRGLYFTSSVQRDILSGAESEAWDRDAAPIVADRAHFLRDLYAHRLFRETGLTCQTSVARSRRQRLTAMGYVAVMTLAVGLGATLFYGHRELRSKVQFVQVALHDFAAPERTGQTDKFEESLALSEKISELQQEGFVGPFARLFFGSHSDVSGEVATVYRAQVEHGQIKELADRSRAELLALPASWGSYEEYRSRYNAALAYLALAEGRQPSGILTAVIGEDSELDSRAAIQILSELIDDPAKRYTEFYEQLLATYDDPDNASVRSAFAKKERVAKAALETFDSFWLAASENGSLLPQGSDWAEGWRDWYFLIHADRQLMQWRSDCLELADQGVPSTLVEALALLKYCCSSLGLGIDVDPSARNYLNLAQEHIARVQRLSNLVPPLPPLSISRFRLNSELKTQIAQLQALLPDEFVEIAKKTVAQSVGHFEHAESSFLARIRGTSTAERHDYSVFTIKLAESEHQEEPEEGAPKLMVPQAIEISQDLVNVARVLGEFRSMLGASGLVSVVSAATIVDGEVVVADLNSDSEREWHLFGSELRERLALVCFSEDHDDGLRDSVSPFLTLARRVYLTLELKRFTEAVLGGDKPQRERQELVTAGCARDSFSVKLDAKVVMPANFAGSTSRALLQQISSLMEACRSYEPYPNETHEFQEGLRVFPANYYQEFAAAWEAKLSEFSGESLGLVPPGAAASRAELPETAGLAERIETIASIQLPSALLVESESSTATLKELEAVFRASTEGMVTRKFGDFFRAYGSPAQRQLLIDAYGLFWKEVQHFEDPKSDVLLSMFDVPVGSKEAPATSWGRLTACEALLLQPDNAREGSPYYRDRLSKAVMRLVRGERLRIEGLVRQAFDDEWARLQSDFGQRIERRFPFVYPKPGAESLGLVVDFDTFRQLLGRVQSLRDRWRLVTERVRTDNELTEVGVGFDGGVLFEAFRGHDQARYLRALEFFDRVNSFGEWAGLVASGSSSISGRLAVEPRKVKGNSLAEFFCQIAVGIGDKSPSPQILFDTTGFYEQSFTWQFRDRVNQPIKIVLSGSGQGYRDLSWPPRKSPEDWSHWLALPRFLFCYSYPDRATAGQNVVFVQSTSQPGNLGSGVIAESYYRIELSRGLPILPLLVEAEWKVGQ